MNEQSDLRYKQFRNYMCNELGVTRQDIEAWTKQAAANEIEKKIGQINLDKMAEVAVKQAAANAVGGPNAYSNGDLMRQALARELSKQFELRFVAPKQS